MRALGPCSCILLPALGAVLLSACEAPSSKPGRREDRPTDSGRDDSAGDAGDSANPGDSVATLPDPARKTQDFDGDGQADLAIGDPGGGRVYVYRGSPDGVADTAVRALDGGSEFGAAVGWLPDVDGDGGADLLVAEDGAAVVVGAAGELARVPTDGAVAGVVGAEVLIAVSDTSGVRVVSVGSGEETLLAEPALAPRLAVVDLDGDGFDELFWVDEGELWWVPGPVDRSSARSVALESPLSGDVYASASGDLYVVGETVVRVADPTGAAWLDVLPLPASPGGFWAGDLDGDGEDELAAAVDGVLSVYDGDRVTPLGAGAPGSEMSTVTVPATCS
jgi:hypothetical protein